VSGGGGWAAAGGVQMWLTCYGAPLASIALVNTVLLDWYEQQQLVINFSELRHL
jgi:hypothetical protein